MTAKQGVIPLKGSSSGGAGTVTSFAFTDANGFTGTVLTPTVTPTLSIGTNVTGVLYGDGVGVAAATNAQLPTMTSTVGGAVPTPPNNTTTFLRGDGTFATPVAGTGTVTHTAGALTANAVVVGNGTDDVKVLASLGTTTTVLHGNAAGLPTFGAVSLTADVSGVTPIANGGTNSAATATAGGIGYGTGTAHAYTAAGTAGQAWLSGGAGVPTRTTGTLALAGNFATSGAFASTFTMTGTTTVTFPTSGTLLSTAAAVTVAQGGTSLGTLTLNNVILGNGTSAPTFVAPGSSGNVLTSNGTTWQSTAPSAAAPGLVCLASTTVSGAVSSVDFTSLITSTYDEYEIHILSAVPVTNGDQLAARTSANNGSTYASTAADYYAAGEYYTSTAGTNAGSLVGDRINLSGTANVSNLAAAGGVSGVIRLLNPLSTASAKAMVIQMVSAATADLEFNNIGAQRRNSAIVDAFRIYFRFGDIATGLFKFYGVRKAP